jgi:CMP-N,N'-diacetyllegionaminic acid synthase
VSTFSPAQVVAVIPARGGSKGVPRKNIRRLGPWPLLVHTARAARAAAFISRLVVSTEDDEILEVARGYGLDVPFVRPARLACDDTPMLPVIQHAVGCLEDLGERYDAVCVLQPTTPFRRAADIDACIDRLRRSALDAVVSVAPVPAEHNPHWVYFTGGDGLLRLATGEATPIARRQDLPAAYHRDGAVYVVRRDVLMAGSLFGTRLGGYLSDAPTTINIDTPEDWARADEALNALAERE